MKFAANNFSPPFLVLGLASNCTIRHVVHSYVFTSTKNLREPWITSGEICGAIVGKGCGKWEEINNWTVDIPEKKLWEDELSEEKRVQQNDRVLK